MSAFATAGQQYTNSMSIEGGARSGLIAPDETTFAYLKGRPLAPAGEDWDKAIAYWRTLPTDAGARYDKSVALQASDIAPSLTWGTSPEDVVPITGAIPDPESFADASKRVAAQKSLDYMGLTAGTAMQDIPIEHDGDVRERRARPAAGRQGRRGAGLKRPI